MKFGTFVHVPAKDLVLLRKDAEHAKQQQANRVIVSMLESWPLNSAQVAQRAASMMVDSSLAFRLI